MAPQLRSSPVWGNIFITLDLTKAERYAARKLREELKACKQAVEDSLVIRNGRITSVASSGRKLSASTKANPTEIGQHDDNSSSKNGGGNQRARVLS